MFFIKSVFFFLPGKCLDCVPALLTGSQEVADQHGVALGLMDIVQSPNHTNMVLLQA